MIPKEIYELANALSREFNIDFDQAVKAAWNVFQALENNGIKLVGEA